MSKIKCKYIKPESIVVYYMIKLLYNTFKHNRRSSINSIMNGKLDDESLNLIIDKYNNIDISYAHIYIVLCESLLKLTIDERYFIITLIKNYRIDFSWSF